MNLASSSLDALRDEVSTLLTLKEYHYVSGTSIKTLRHRIAKGRQPGAVKWEGRWHIDIEQALRPVRERR